MRNFVYVLKKITLPKWVMLFFRWCLFFFPTLLVIVSGWPEILPLSESRGVLIMKIATWGTLVVAGLYLISIFGEIIGKLYFIKRIPHVHLHSALLITNSLLSKFSTNRSDIKDLLKAIEKVFKNFVHPKVEWIDCMVPISTEKARKSGFKFLLTSSIDKVDTWLYVNYHSTASTTERTLIPAAIEGKPWRACGKAFQRPDGLDYVSYTMKRLVFEEFNIATHEVKELKEQYKKWTTKHFFKSLISIAIPSMKREEEVVGVININFNVKNPFGNVENLSSKDRDYILSVMRPFIQCFSAILTEVYIEE